MIDPSESDIGRRVVYVGGEAGTIDRFSDHYVFVTFDVFDDKSKKFVPGSISSPTAPSELSWSE